MKLFKAIATSLMLLFVSSATNAIPLHALLKSFAIDENPKHTVNSWQRVQIKPLRWKFDPYSLEVSTTTKIDKAGKAWITYTGSRAGVDVLNIELPFDHAMGIEVVPLDSDKYTKWKKIQVCPPSNGDDMEDMFGVSSDFYQINMKGKRPFYVIENYSSGPSGGGSYDYTFILDEAQALERAKQGCQ